MSSKPNEKQWQNYAVRIALNTASHPIEYAKVLIQIGYEPIPARPATTLFGRPALKLPNVFQYVRYIKSEDGLTGCYRGLVPKLCGNIISAIACHQVLQQIEKEESEGEVETTENRQLTEQDLFIRNTRKDVISRFTAIIVSHPFHVITVRMMAQFVGGETKYNGLFGSIGEIYRENGVLGFFSGLIPRVLGDLLSIILANSLAFALNTYVFEEAELKVYSTATMNFLASAITYPFQVVSNCMAVTDSGLMAGSPPHMPIYTSWLDCWSNLSEKNQLKRGSSLLLRYYTGPQVVVAGQPMLLTKAQFK